MNNYIQRTLLALALLFMGVAVAVGQTNPPDPNTRTVVFDANGATFATGKTPGVYSSDDAIFTVAGVGVGEDNLIAAYAPGSLLPANKVIVDWYTTASGTGGEVVTDATILQSGTGAYTIYALWAEVTISAVPTGGEVPYGKGKTLTVAASATDVVGADYTVTYQWYTNSSNSNEGGTLISGATAASYKTPVQNIGTYYYYCVVSAKKDDVSITLPTDVATVQVKKIASGDLTAEDFTITLPTDQVYDGSAKTTSAEAKIAGLGAVTVKYKELPDGSPTTTAPTAAGNYQLVIEVAASDNNEAIIIGNAGMMTIAKAPQPVPSDVVGRNTTGTDNGKITGTDNTMEYRANGETEYHAITGNEVTDLPPGIYYVRLKAKDNYLPGADLSITIAQGDTPVYDVTFIYESSTAFAKQSVAQGNKATRPAADPVKAGYIFTGWVTEQGGSTAFDFDAPVTAAVSVYAAWKAIPTYTVGGTVTDSETEPQPLEGVTVVVHPSGATATTSANGSFTLNSIPAGSYNLIATDAAGNSVTLFITVTGNVTITQQIRINGKANSKLVVEAGAPEVVVDKLDELAKEVQGGVAATSNVLIKLVASPLTEDNADGAADIKEKMTEDNMQISSVLDLTLYKKVDDSPEEKLTDLNNRLIDVIIPIPDSLRGRTGFALYRYHGTAVDKITTTPNNGGEKIVLAADGSYLTASLTKFSSYALGTTPMYTVNFMTDAVTIFASQSVAGGAKATAPNPAPVKAGYTLAGWYTDAALTTPWNLATEAVTGNLSLYPKWTVTTTPPGPGPDPNPGPNPSDPDKPTGLDDVAGDAVHVYGSAGSIVITGMPEGRYRIVTFSGMLVEAGTIRSDRMQVSVTAGNYIVLLEAGSYKVTVK